MIYSSGAWLGSLIPNPEPNSWMKRTAALHPLKFQKANANVGGCTTLKQARGARGFWDGIFHVFFTNFPCDPEPEGHTHQCARYYPLTQMAISEQSRCN